MASDPLNRSPYSDGFRTPTPARNPRWPFSGGNCVAPPLLPPAGRPMRPPCAVHVDVPCNCHFFREHSDATAPHVGQPEQARTAGHLQQSGAAWGMIGSNQRARIGPPLHLPRSYGP